MKEIFEFKRDYLFKGSVLSASLSYTRSEHSANILDMELKIFNSSNFDLGQLRKIIENQEAEVIIRKRQGKVRGCNDLHNRVYR